MQKRTIAAPLRRPMNGIVAVLLATILFVTVPAQGSEQYLVVTDQVQDLRKEPVDPAVRHDRDELQLTQVLYNDVLQYKGENQHWYYVEVPDQKKYVSGEWQGYPGWIPKKSVRLIAGQQQCDLVVKDRAAQIYTKPSRDSRPLGIALIGTRFKKTAHKGDYYLVELPDGRSGWIEQESVNSFIPRAKRQTLRQHLLQTAQFFVGNAYRWGGMSIAAPGRATAASGIDCSGLVSLIYRANGIELPRDAQDQWRISERLRVRSVKPGDLIFLSKKGDPDSINHVMLYLGDENYIEAPETGMAVRIDTLRKRFGVGLDELTRENFTVDNRHVYFGRIKDALFSAKGTE